MQIRTLALPTRNPLLDWETSILSGHDQPGSHSSQLQPKLNRPDVLVVGLVVSGQLILISVLRRSRCDHQGLTSPHPLRR